MAKKKHKQPVTTQPKEAALSAKKVERVPLSATPPPALPRKRRAARRRNSFWMVGGLILGLIIIIGIFIVIATNQHGGGVIGGTDKNILSAISHVKPQVFSDVNTGGITSTLKATQANTPVLKGSNGKPEIFYYGAEFCPICAGMRWPVAIALSRFGTFTELPLMVSASNDAPVNIPTFTFVDSKYSSNYIDFVSVEELDRDRHAQQTLTTEQGALLDKYQNRNSYPFIDIAEQFTVQSGFFDPGPLSNLSQKEIADKLTDATDGLTRDIIGSANYLTAAICIATDNKPAEVCTQGPIPVLVSSLKNGALGSMLPSSGVHTFTGVFRERQMPFLQPANI